MNSRLDLLQPYPFEKLRGLMKGVKGNEALRFIALSVGEPRHPTPQFVKEAWSKHVDGLANYPTTLGSENLRLAIGEWIKRRFLVNKIDHNTQIIPTLGSREALFSIIQVLIDEHSAKKYVICPNPFYQIYEGAALLAGATPYFVNADPVNHQIDYSNIDPSVLKQTAVVFVCSPGNPTGKIMTLDEWKVLFELSDTYGFTIVSDECYSEIYPDETSPPLGALTASLKLGRKQFDRLVVMSSLSKRSNVPGMRSAFAAGDASLLKSFLLYRTYHGSAMNPTIQKVSELAWQDESHVIENRRLYREKFTSFYDIVNNVLPLEKPEASFYYWVKTPIDDVLFTQQLFAQHHIQVLPGSVLARDNNGTNPGKNRIRIALVGSIEETIDAANRIKTFVSQL
ncbi:succinyldiaminopimelate transaminase [Ferrovum sp. PN-J185]|uniref:succinyldiaminopimelate transaminase n=1 Tax=Ferrovum sp. PN-J185 TaxID=1356306 RepID=UPI00079A95C2|nr:succinyldiaminopimelate transaminase [Ferrovum sp. PN-J185]KXW56293.1 LL-diaminopimelate aminotransferase [Ferrovum sp. PN-J185]MCC6069017.1 succinyldiaminopimelate transaminase [Ferrovum sp. PN-J185]MDE1891003.1 succinyldiaminopimelate transaminase [Betaproteobacteria bacterium]MDE2055685.1 succinyldiaminopimelate transaminase [Betaproteobacteria bacterium]